MNPRAFGVPIPSSEHVPTRLPEVDDCFSSSSDEESPAVPFHCDSCLQRMKEEFPGMNHCAVQREMTVVGRKKS